MNGPYVYYGDKLLGRDETRPEYEILLHGNYVYAHVTTLDRHPLYLNAHIACALDSYETLYSTRPSLDLESLRQHISRLLEINRMPSGSNSVTLFLFPPETSGIIPDPLLVSGRPLIYRGYSLADLRPRAVVVNYELPFGTHRTAVSLTASGYMADFARRNGAHIALRVDRSEQLISAGEYPVIALKGKHGFLPTEKICGKSVERDLLIRLCDQIGIGIESRTVSAEELSEMDEIIIFDFTGIRCLLCCGENYYLNLAGQKMERFLAEITRQGFAG